MTGREMRKVAIALVGEDFRKESSRKGRLRFVVTSAFAVGSLLLTACSGTSAVLPDPDIKIYLLDLTSSGDVKNQFRLIQENLAQDMTSESLGSPYAMNGPSLTKFYFVGTNSRALREFSLQDHQVAYDLFQYVDDENNNTRTEKFWRLLSEKYQNYMIQKLEGAESVNKQQCLSDFNEIFLPTWSSDRVREVYSSFVCRMAVYSMSNYRELQQYIDDQSKPKVQKASDVFGALSKIGSQVDKFQQEL
jgi:hypothetical protein